METNEFYDFIVKMISIAKIGLTYSKDPYAIDNYQEIQKVSMKMLEDFEGVKFDRPNYFEKNIYPTPNISVRTAIFNEKGDILLVREAGEEAYSIPGGWCDLGDTPSEAAIKECKQEAGIDVKIKRIVGLLNVEPWINKTCNSQYVVIFEAVQTSPFAEHTYETDDVDYFPVDNLPKLSRKNRETLLIRIIDACKNNKTIFD